MDLKNVTSEIQNYVSEKRNDLNGVVYENLCKLAAKLCFSEGRVEEGIFYLSEAHAASIRVETLHQYELCEAKHEYKKTSFSPNLCSQYLEFSSEFFFEKYHGLCRRLKDLPKEWTIVQLTRSYSSPELWNRRQTGCVSNGNELHITKFSCGDNKEPCHILVPEPQGFEQNGATYILKMLQDITSDRSLHMKTEPIAKIKSKRSQNSSLLRTIVREIQTHWLKEWCFLLLGKLYDEKLVQCIDERLRLLFNQLKTELSLHEKCLISQMAYGCAHLGDEDIDNAVKKIIIDSSLQEPICECICDIKRENLLHIKAKRHPVILLIDQKFEVVPWEVCPLLSNHPVSRLPSIHFAHAIFKHHESTIVAGNKILSTPPSGFFVINPDSSLQNTEKRILQFLKLRSPKWNGVVGKAPTSNEFLDVLVNYDILLYCGHGNGTQYFNSYNIQELNIKAVPFLFGCSSVQYHDIGGRLSFRSLSNSYLMAASPCALGMLWNVTNTDTDYVALTLLNHWLPGKPVDLKKIDGFGNNQYVETNLSFKNSELLRVLKIARDSANLFINGAAMVVYGIPVKLEN